MALCIKNIGRFSGMNKYIEIVEDKDKELVVHRFKNKIRYYKYIGSAFVMVLL